jgi:hypothetical protein
MSEQLGYWKICSSCKKNIGFKQKYFECSVSTCQGKRTGYVFCSVPCWECHLPGAKHRDAGAIEKISPSLNEWQNELAQHPVVTTVVSNSTLAVKPTVGVGGVASPQRRIISQAPSVQGSPHVKSTVHSDILVVVSKMKNYVKEIADMNTSGEVADILSDLIREACDEAVIHARNDGRKTIMGRDFKASK